MAKSRKSPASALAAPHGAAEPRRRPAASSWRGDSPLVWLTIAALWCVYLALFFIQPLPGLIGGDGGEPMVRWQFLMVHLFAPEFLVRTWVGQDFDRFGFVDRIPIFLTAAFIIASAGSAGWLLLRRLGLTGGLSRLEVWVFSTAAGLNVLSLYTLAIGLAGGLRVWWLFAAPMWLALIVAGGLIAVDRLRLPLRREKEAERERADDETANNWDWFDRHGIWLIAPFALLMALGGVLPPWEFDVREYHLQAPKEWFQQGRIGFMPHNVYANMPLGAEMHALPAMALMGGEPPWWRGALAGKLILACFSIFTALAIYAAGRRFVSGAAGAVGALVYISTPLIGQISMQGLVECALGFYLFTAFYAVLLWRGDVNRENDSRVQVDGAGVWKWLLVAGFLAGGAAACKYTGVVFVVLPLLAWVFITRPAAVSGDVEESDQNQRAAPRRAGWGCNWRGAMVFSLAAAIGCGLWYGKNWALAGNPTFPLAYSVFGGKSWNAEKNQRWHDGHRPPINKNGWSYSLSDLQNRLKRFALTNEWISPLVVPLAPLAFFAARRRRLVWILGGAFACVYLVWWLSTHRLDRFWLPALPLVALLAGIGFTWRDREAWRWMAGGLLTLGLGSNLLVMSSRAMGDNRFFVALDDLHLDERREEDSFWFRVHPAHRYLNQAVPDGCRVLVVGDAQAFDIECGLLYNTCFDDCIFEQLMKGRTAEQRRAALRENRISHVFIHWLEIARYRSPGNYGFTDYVTSQLVHGELVREQGLLRIDPEAPQNPEVFEVFEVVGADSGCGG